MLLYACMSLALEEKYFFVACVFVYLIVMLTLWPIVRNSKDGYICQPERNLFFLEIIIINPLIS